MRRAMLVWLVLGLVGHAAHAGVAGPSGFITLDAPVPQLLGTSPLSINDHDNIVGFFVSGNPDNPNFGAFYAQSPYSPVTVLAGPAGSIGGGAAGINNAGDIVGNYAVYNASLQTEVVHGFLLPHGGSYLTIDAPNATYTEGVGINNHDTIVGFYYDSPFVNGSPTGPVKAYVDSGGSFTTVQVPLAGTTGTELFGINDQGLATGAYDDASGAPHGFIYNAKIQAFTYLSPPGSAGELGDGNNLGIIPADAEVYDPNSLLGFDPTGYIYDGTTFQPYNLPGEAGTIPYAINDSGHVVGLYVDQSGAIHGFAAVPEPVSAALFGAGLVSLGFARRKLQRSG